jgi:hypothetical protein
MNSTNPTNCDSGFLKGIRLSAFLDTYQEWHALVEGFSEVLCPWPARHKLSRKLSNDLRGDHHYYAFGRVLGVIVWIIIARIIQVVFF